MIVMLDGTYTELGPQVASALSGYLIGIACCVSSFLLGRHIHDWLRAQHDLPEPDSVVADEECIEVQHQNESLSVAKSASWPNQSSVWARICLLLAPVLVWMGLAVAFVLGDVLNGVAFDRRMWMVVILAPLGALVRWKLSELNDRSWLPRGTLIANLVASVLSACIESLDSRLVSSDHIDATWTLQLLLAADAGFAGCLSTVSTLIKEMFEQDTPRRAHVYCFGTIVSAMLLGLAVYSPIARYGDF